MSDVDLRGFAYPLQALIQRKQWQVDECARELAAALHRLKVAIEEHASSVAACREQAARAHRAWREHADPVAYQRLLAFLAQLQDKNAQLAKDIEKLRLEHAQARDAYLARRQELDGLHHHRSNCLEDYAAAERSKQLVQADQDWVQRSHWRRQQRKARA